MKKRRKKGHVRINRADRRAKLIRNGPITAPLQSNPKSDDKIKLIARFIGVGLLNTAVGYALYGLLILLTVPYLAALLIATIMGMIFNYFSIGRMVFRTEGGRLVFAKFIAAYSVVYGINATALDILIKHFQFNLYIGQALCIPLSVLISWLLMNYWVYKNNDK